MYQLEVKRYLVEDLFHPDHGWNVTVDVDGMERLEQVARDAEAWLVKAGVTIGVNPGRTDIVATRGNATVLVEVVGDSAKGKADAVNAALGQVVKKMGAHGANGNIRGGLAVPDTIPWEDQLKNIPAKICDRNLLTRWLVGRNGVREL